MDKAEPDHVALTVRLPKSVARWVRTKAAAARRSLSSEIVVMLEAAQDAEKARK